MPLNILKRIPSIFWIVLLCWAAFALAFASQIVWMEQPKDDPAGWAKALEISFAGWMTWVPLTLGLYWLVKRYPIERSYVLRSGMVMLCAVVAIVFLRAAYVYFTNPVFNWYRREPLPDFGSVLLTSFDNNFFLAWIVVGLMHAIVFYRRSNERGHKVAELESSLASTQLEALRAQLNPHFLFNALNSVAEMVHRDAEQADRMLISLAALLRDSLSSEQDQMRPLREELALVEHYLMIEKIRLGERLQLTWDVQRDSLELPIPVLILQPLVENAIVHGIARRRSPGSLRVRGRLLNGRLLLEVENSVASENAITSGTGIGLQSTRSRLQLLYGGRAHLALEMTEAGDHLVRLDIPAGATTGGLAIRETVE